MAGANGGIWPSEGLTCGEWVDRVGQMLTAWFLLHVIPITALLSRLWISIACDPLPTFHPTSYPFVSTCDPSFAHKIGQVFSYLVGNSRSSHKLSPN